MEEEDDEMRAPSRVQLRRLLLSNPPTTSRAISLMLAEDGNLLGIATRSKDEEAVRTAQCTASVAASIWSEYAKAGVAALPDVAPLHFLLVEAEVRLATGRGEAAGNARGAVRDVVIVVVVVFAVVFILLFFVPVTFSLHTPPLPRADNLRS